MFVRYQKASASTIWNRCRARCLRRVDNLLNIANVLGKMQVSVLLDSDVAQVDSNDWVLNKAGRDYGEH